MRHTLALTALFPAVALAQAGRPELAGDTQALLWVLAIALGVAFFHIRNAFRKSLAMGELVLVGWVVLAVCAYAFPAARALVCLGAAGWLVYGFVRVT